MEKYIESIAKSKEAFFLSIDPDRNSVERGQKRYYHPHFDCVIEEIPENKAQEAFELGLSLCIRVFDKVGYELNPLGWYINDGGSQDWKERQEQELSPAYGKVIYCVASY